MFTLWTLALRWPFEARRNGAALRLQGGGAVTGSQEICWWSVHQFITALVAQGNNDSLPWAGTPEWAALSDGDPRKLLSLAVAGEHWTLRVQIGQEQRAQAAEDVWGGEDWRQVAQQVQRRREIDELRRIA